MIESLEGKRGEPRVRPPFPVEQGYLKKPTVVNNVETFCSVTKIIKNGAEWYKKHGTEQSTGTKLLSVSGDCGKPGIYEIEWGQTVGEFLKMVEAENTLAVQIGGPSGVCLNAKESERKICFEDIPTGGSMMVIGKDRDLIKVVKNFTQFFVEESCGCCVPCRSGGVMLNDQLDKILAGEATMNHLERVTHWSKTIFHASRCGLGQTCFNPILSTMSGFPEIYKNRVKHKVTYHTVRTVPKSNCILGLF